MVQAWRHHRRDREVYEGERWSGRDQGSSRHADEVGINSEQKAKGLWNNPAAAFLTIDAAHGGQNTVTPAHRYTDGTERRFRTEVLSAPKRAENPGSRYLCVGRGQHQDGKQKNTRTEQKQKEKESRLDKSLQPSGNGGVFP